MELQQHRTNGTPKPTHHKNVVQREIQSNSMNDTRREAQEATFRYCTERENQYMEKEEEMCKKQRKEGSGNRKTNVPTLRGSEELNKELKMKGNRGKL